MQAGPVGGERIVAIRTPSGISGDMLVTGLALIARADQEWLDATVSSLGLPDPAVRFHIEPAEVQGVSGWQARVSISDEAPRRSYKDIRKIIRSSGLSERAREYARETFSLLAKAESVVHHCPLEEVIFHEVGAVDSILDICLSAALFDYLEVASMHCSPLPICDGEVQTAHGLLATPAPAVQVLLEDIPVYTVDSWGETVTPTAVAILKALRTTFGPWPSMSVERMVRVFGNRLLPAIPNGAIFALGAGCERNAPRPG